MRPSVSRALAVALLVGAALGLHELAVAPLLSAHEARAEERADLERRLEAYRRMSASRGPVEKRLAELEQRWRDEGLVFRAGNRSRAEASVQQHVARLVGASGGGLIRSQMLPGRTEDDLYRVSARLQLRVPGDTLPALLHGLQASLPYLVIDELSISARVSERGVLTAQVVPPLTVDMVVSGFAMLEEEVADGGA